MFFLLLLLPLVHAFAQPPAQINPQPDDIVAGLEPRVAAGYREMRLGDFRLYFNVVDRDYAQHVADVVQSSERRLAEELDLRGFRGSQIVVAWDPPHFYRLAGSGTPHWAGAVTNPEQQRIVLKSPRWGDAEPDAGATIRHEMTHLGVARLRRGNRIPVWLEEGLAVRLSGLPLSVGSEGGASLSKAISLGSLISLDKLESLNSYGSINADLAYKESESAVRFFVERHGRVALIQMLTLTGRGVGFNEAFDQATGGGYFRFESEWKTWLKKQSGFYFLLDFSSWVWVGIILLGIAVWWMRRQRARRILERWSNEEEEEDDEFLV